METHRLLKPFNDFIVKEIIKSADSEGFADVSSLVQSWGVVRDKWDTGWTKWEDRFMASRQQAAGIAFGALVVEHNTLMAKAKRRFQESTDKETLTRLWNQRRAKALTASQRRLGGDQMELSQRVWKLNNEGLRDIRATMVYAMTNRTNAYDLAAQIQAKIGYDERFPAWAEERLYDMTPTERKASDRGLLRGPGGSSSGVAYKALRLARTEIQFANHGMATEIATHAPWVTGRKTMKSDAHPEHDICDTLADGGPYDVTEELLPAHPNCLCYYVNVIEDEAFFLGKIGDWLQGENSYLDEYQQWLNTDDPLMEFPWELADDLEMWLGTGQDAQGAAIKGPVVLEQTSAMQPAVPMDIPKNLPPPVTVPTTTVEIPVVKQEPVTIQIVPQTQLVTEETAPQWLEQNPELQEWGKSFTATELKAVRKYQSEEYQSINYELREGNIVKPNTVKNIDKILARASLPKEMTVYRGMQSREMAKNLDNLVGAVIKDDAFVSTSVIRERAASFTGRDPEGEVLFELTLPKGSNAGFLPLEEDLHEYEILVQRGRSYQVTSVRRETYISQWRGGKEIVRHVVEAILL